MADPVASYTFLPWLRRGFATRILAPATSATSGRPNVSVQLTFNNDAAMRESVDLTMFGPGDIKGLDPRAVSRVWPRPDVFDAESNCFAMIEFDEPDLPWRYTPLPPDSQRRLMPWLALVVLAEEDEFERRSANSIRVKRPAALPKATQLWAWAHAQVSGASSVDAATLKTILANEPHRVSSRCMSPRRLEPQTVYRAFLVPTFERGRLAGLGLEPTGGVELAWNGTAEVDLPVYYEWRFQTSTLGDFEYLAGLLEGRRLPRTLGTRQLDVTAPGMTLPSASPTPIGMKGALCAIDAPPDDWANIDRAAFVPHLAALLNRPDDLLASDTAERVVAPPLYGRWHAPLTRLEPASRPVWTRELNEDPRWRVAAGLGAKVVGDKQQELLASAWDQVGEIRRLNERLMLAQLARAAGTRLFDRHVAPARLQSLLLLSHPVHALVKDGADGARTVRGTMLTSAIPRAMLEPAFRRIGRPLGPLGRRQGRPTRPAGDLLAAINSGRFVVAPVPKTPDELATSTKLGKNLVPEWVDADVYRALRRLSRAELLRWAAVFLVLALICFLTGFLFPLGIVMLGAAVLALRLAASPPKVLESLDRGVALRDGTLTAQDVRTAPVRDGFTAVELAPGQTTHRDVAAPAIGTARNESTSSVKFREAAAKLADRFRRPIPEIARPRPINLTGLAATVKTRLHPQNAVTKAMQGLFTVRPGLPWAPNDPIEPIMAAPDFPQPMYEPLKAISQDWLLPGVSEVPPNTVGALATNQEFIESYMVGLNHEMSRVLLFNEYPTDQRGSYFRQFWDIRGYVGLPGNEIDPEAMRDILHIHTWPKTNGLGRNTARRPPPSGEHLVLLVRGELLKRYPTTTVQAVRARWVAGRRELDETTVKAPVFGGTLDPDLVFYGFELSAPDARGSTSPSGDPGWFFVLKEHPTEPRFGLDTTRGTPLPGAPPWSALSWQDLAADETALAALTVIDLDASLPDTSAIDPGGIAKWHADAGTGPTGARSSDIAHITLRLPFRVAIHADDLLPLS